MSPGRISDLSTRASTLVRQFFSNKNEVGFMSCAIYDTAWVSMIAKDSQWLFPQCFDYILKKQQEDGGWESYKSDIDGILNTAASLLALKAHSDSTIKTENISTEELQQRINSATDSLRNQLQRWNVQDTVHVGFEYLVPAHLKYLEAVGIAFDFPGRKTLVHLNQLKMGKFDPRYLYSKHKTTALHSLEAFVGVIDYNKVKHHKQSGSFMASPSSTAVYLMYASEWDDEAEQYLREVLRHGAGRGNGGIPSAFPSKCFELSWVLTTLLHNGFDVSDIDNDLTEQAKSYLEYVLSLQNGVVGFAPMLQADADDTSKVLFALSKLGHPAACDGLQREFEAETHFRTYRDERNPSFSANCNVLISLLAQPEPARFSSQIEKATRFLCDLWWDSDGSIEDKWNLTQTYPYMLLTEGLASLLELWSEGALPSIPDDLIRDRVCVTLFQVLVRTLQSQNEDGSWGPTQSTEETAYAILVLANGSSLPFLKPLQSVIKNAVTAGRDFIESTPHHKPDYLWVEKVTYGSDILRESYVLAALKADYEKGSESSKLESIVEVPWPKITEFVKFYSRIPLFSQVPAWQLSASLVEGYLFLPQLKQVRLDIFPRTNMEEDKYFEYIPFTWTSNNNRRKACLSASTLKQMMVISFLNYQADEYMEAVVGRYFGGQKSPVIPVIEKILADIDAETRAKSTGRTSPSPSSEQNTCSLPINKKRRISKTESATPSLDDVATVLDSFVRYIMAHPHVTSASALQRDRVKNELKIFLLSHIQQTADNESFYNQQPHGTATASAFQAPRTSFYRWVHSTSSDHTSCPYSFALFQCLIEPSESADSNTETSVQARYIYEAMARHLAVLCRMYNDYGSVARDRDEKNLNSVDFPDFGFLRDGTEDDKARKRNLMALAEFERAQMEAGLNALGRLAGDDKISVKMLEKVRAFVDVTDLYGQIYVARDIASRM